MFGNWIRQTTTTTGTGALTLDAVTGYPGFNDIFSLSGYFAYAILNDGDGTPIEAGVGHLSSSTVLVRDKILATYVAGTYDNTSPAAATLAAGTKRVICAPLADLLAPIPTGNVGWNSVKISFPTGLQMASNTKTINTNEFMGACLRWETAAEISSLLLQVTTGSGSGRVQLGVYSTKHDGYPGKLVCRTGDIDTTTTGLKTAALSGGNIILPPGWYWFGVGCGAASPPAVRAYAAGSLGQFMSLNNPMGFNSGTNFNVGFSFMRAGLSAGWTVLPDTISLSSAASITADYCPTVGVQLS